MTGDDIQLEDVPEWPLIHIDLHPDPTTGAPLLTIGGARVTVPAGHDPRRYAIQAASRRATVLGRPIRAIATDGNHEWPLIIHPDGAITDPSAAPRHTDRARRATQTPNWHMPAGLGIGIAGLVLLAGLAGLAASMLVVGPTAQRSAAAPPPTPPAPANTAAATAPPASTRPAAPAPTGAPATSTSRQPPPDSAPSTARSHPPTITFDPPSTPTRPAPPTPPRATSSTAAVPRTHRQPATRPRPAPSAKPSTATPPPRAETTTPSTSDAPTPHGPAIRGSVPVGGYCLAGFIGVAIAERCAPDTAEQTWTLQDGQLRQPDGCLTVSDQRAVLATCAGDDTQHWERTHTGQLHNTGTNTCLIPTRNDRDTETVAVVTCSA